MTGQASVNITLTGRVIVDEERTVENISTVQYQDNGATITKEDSAEVDIGTNVPGTCRDLNPDYTRKVVSTTAVNESVEFTCAATNDTDTTAQIAIDCGNGTKKQ